MGRASVGGTDPAATLALLWRAPAAGPGRRGPGRSVDVDDIVDAAIALADQAGLPAVSMRAVAREVDVSPMALYTYVSSKAALLDLMVDTCYLRMPRPRWRARSWRRRLAAVAEANRDLVTAHPWLVDVAPLNRPPLGPGLLAKYEHELAALDGTGLSDVDRDAALSFLLVFVHGYARAARDAARALARTDRSDADWWRAHEPLLARVLDSDAYPRAVRVGTAAGRAQRGAWDPARAWRFGLARVLDGLAALVDRPRPT